jgi:hypothetical protein
MYRLYNFKKFDNVLYQTIITMINLYIKNNIFLCMLVVDNIQT